MRIHTGITTEQLAEIVAGVPGTSLVTAEQKVSRTHARAFEVRLAGSGAHGGQYGASDFKSATWDEWGTVMGGIFALDPATRMGGSTKQPVYADRDDFDYQTVDRFVNGLPEDTHARHKWGTPYADRFERETSWECTKCSAQKIVRWAR